MELEIYRARIGLYNLRKCVGYKKNTKLQCCINMSRQCGKILYILEAAFFILTMIVIVDVSSGGLVEIDCHLDPGLLRLSNNLPNLARGPLRVQNYQLKTCDWNSYMKAMNGNRTCIDVAHWNGGSSHLGKSSKGQEKLEHMNS